MNILELDSYNLADTVKFHDRLNPRLWDGSEHLRPEVKAKLMEVARDFQEFLGVPDLDVKDITISGSNAAFNYTPASDIDLHLVIDIPNVAHDEVYRELFNAKKYQYNDEHDIRIRDADVELYAQDSAQPHHSQGIYSILNDSWVSVPKRTRAEIDDVSTRSKFEDLAARINEVIKSQDLGRMDSLMKKIKTMRQTGLEQQGEFGADNLAFKLLRNNGYIKRLIDAKQAARDQELSLAELARPKQRTRYGFSESPDGVNPTTKMFLEQPEDQNESAVREFIKFVVDRLGINDLPEIVLHNDPAWSEQNHSFGRYTPELHTLEVNLANRHVMDILRTTAHELVHCKQNQEHALPDQAGDTGSDWENQANAMAGVIMRDYAEHNPQMFENASGYIPRNKKEARDPRYSMALTVDIKPGQVGKEANKLALNTGRNGEPALLMKSANLQESLAAEFELFEASKGKEEPWDRDGYEPPGPEFPPQMPAGTTKIDVTDLTDWYRLGQDISDMDDAEPEDYNQGPPQTVITFASDELEQQYLKQFKRLGLKTHDMDPDVEGGEDTTGKHLRNKLAEELALFEEDLFEVKMTSKNLANLAKDIKGARVGLEFEMIVPNVANDENGDMEPDYDQDERVRDIDDAVNFFDDGDYNSRNEIRRLREQMESDYFDWQTEQIDQEWDRNGFEFFQEYLDREEPFDPEDYQDRAIDEIKAEFPELDPTSEDFGELVAEKLREINSEYYVETWEAQGRSYDYAREEFEEEQRDNYSENAWLDDRGIRFASDVQNEYSDVQWPYWSSNSDSEGDIESVALDFMNAMGMDSVAISSSYHGSYKKWVGNGWVSIGSNKPDDCFTIEPDGSLEGDNSSDTGLEFVSPPIPLEDIGTVMSRVQNWAGNYGAYTGDHNKTSIHTNISIPGYDLNKLDYLKAALLLGDEYVLREFDRIGNTYAAPAIEKVRALVKQNPEKAQQLLDKMKSQLNAEASKLIHSGQTNKFTSINTKDNRVEFRSPGGDYLSIIADNPQKMVDTINRMVVTLDAAMDPNKYKEEYQKKLYKMLTGQQSGREAKTGAKREMKKDDKDLLNIFSRYAAGELPRAALKSFVRQAQLERKVKAGKETGRMWWDVSWGNGRVEVVANNKKEAVDTAFKESYWAPDQPDTPQAQQFRNSLTAKPLRPYVEPTYNTPTGDADTDSLQRELGLQAPQNVPTLNGRPSNPDGNWVIVDVRDRDAPVYRYMASDNTDAYNVLRQWITANPGDQWGFIQDSTQRLGQPGQQTTTQQPDNWGIWINANNRFANEPGEYARGEVPPLYRFPSRAEAELWIEQQRAARPNMRSDIEVREIEPSTVTTQEPGGNGRPAYTMTRPAEPVPGSTLDLQRQRAAQASQGVDTRVDYELYNRTTGTVIDTFPARNDGEARVRLDDYRNLGAGQSAPEAFGVRRGPGVTNTASTADAAQGGIVDVAGEHPAATPQANSAPFGNQFSGQWKVVDGAGRELYVFRGVGNNQADANRIAANWARENNYSGALDVLPVMI